MATALPLVNVTVRLVDQDGDPVIGAKVSAKLMTVERYKGYVIPEEYLGVTDDQGTCIVRLFPNELGTEGSEYRFKISYPKTSNGKSLPSCHIGGSSCYSQGGKSLTVYASIPNADCNLEDVCDLDPYPIRGSGQIFTEQILSSVEVAKDAAERAEAAIDKIEEEKYTACECVNQACECAKKSELASEKAESQADRIEGKAEVAANKADEAKSYASLSKAWAESDACPDPDNNPDSKSAKSWANIARNYTQYLKVVSTGTESERYICDRFADILNVKDFGAVGDGKTNDTVPFIVTTQYAKSKGIKQIFVPIGIYRIATFTSIKIDMLFGLGLIISDEGASKQLYIGGEGSGCEGCDLFAEEARNAAREAISAADEAAAYKEGILASYEDIMGKETFDALFLVNQFAPQMIASARQDILGYREWYADGIEKIGQLDSGAMQMQQRCRNAINGHVRDLRLHRLQLAAADGRTPYLFIVAGQSNAVGYGKDANGGYESAVDMAQFWAWNEEPAVLKPLKDPVYKSVHGSAWPAFCRRFFELTGRKVYILNVASGGAAVTDGGYTTTNTWADNTYGTLRETARNQFNALKAHLEQQQMPFVIGGVLWCQGEADGGRIASGSVTTQNYIDGTLDVFAFFRELTGKTTLDMFVSKIGFSTTTLAPGTPIHDGYVAVQEAQEKLCRDNEHVHMAFRLAPTFFDVGYMSDSIHYNQTGYNMMGEALASCAATTLNI